MIKNAKIKSTMLGREDRGKLMNTINQVELTHHGVKGMKWGVRNGPPYPIDRSNDIGKLTMKKSKVMLGKTPAMQYKWTDKNNHPVAEFKIWNWWDGVNVSDLEINEKYRGRGLSYQLLDYATKKLGVRNLAVNKTNGIAKHVYDKYGFKVVDQDDDLYYMSLEDE